MLLIIISFPEISAGLVILSTVISEETAVCCHFSFTKIANFTLCSYVTYSVNCLSQFFVTFHKKNLSDFGNCSKSRITWYGLICSERKTARSINISVTLSLFDRPIRSCCVLDLLLS
jgi:hypothetical protein